MDSFSLGVSETAGVRRLGAATFKVRETLGASDAVEGLHVLRPRMAALRRRAVSPVHCTCGEGEAGMQRLLPLRCASSCSPNARIRSATLRPVWGGKLVK